MTPQACFLLVALVLLSSNLTRGASSGGGGDQQETCAASGGTGGGASNDDAVAAASRLPRQPPCRIYLAESTVPDAGLGVFSGVDMPRGAPIGQPDVIIQLPDPSPAHTDGLSLLLNDYLWDGQETGGQYEGIKTLSVIPGIGMAANGHIHLYNALPFRPDVDECGVARTKSPGAGAFTHYHNYSFFSQKPIASGGEIFVNYGSNWFREREGRKMISPITDDGSDTADKHTRSVDWLEENGICLDNLQPGISKIKDAGRGAFARRFLPKDSIVAPVPVVQITKKDALRTVRVKADDSVEEGWQLLLNYCFGHPQSSVLFFPYGNGVNLINHGAEKANVILRWSNSTQHRGKDWPESMSVDELKRTNKAGLMLEFVALRDIHPGEEIYCDYGNEWVQSWKEHKRLWKPWSGPTSSYSPSYIVDDVAQKIRTQKEQKEYPYADNLFTSCFYRYSDNAGAEGSTSDGDKVETTAVKWELKRGIFDLSNLRPCTILKRDQTHDGKHYLYTVLIRNRYGLREEERIPKGVMHVVNFVPRHAIRFSDKIYTTDAHLPNAFRHEIGLPEGVFPEAWKDLKAEQSS